MVRVVVVETTLSDWKSEVLSRCTTLALSTLIIWSVFWKFQAILKIYCAFRQDFQSIATDWTMKILLDSNHRPIIYETIALSLSYGGICAVGVVRTHDSILKRDVLYQLSYDSIKTWRWLFTVSIHNMRWFSGISSDESKKHRIFSWIHAWFSPMHSLTCLEGMD